MKKYIRYWHNTADQFCLSSTDKLMEDIFFKFWMTNVKEIYNKKKFHFFYNFYYRDL